MAKRKAELSWDQVWRRSKVRDVEDLRNTPPEISVKQFFALMKAKHEQSPHEEEGVEEVRRRWLTLKGGTIPTESVHVSSPGAALADLLAWWHSHEISGVMVGAFAVAIHGRPRAAQDLDGLINLKPAKRKPFLAAAAEFQIASRVADPLTYMRESRSLPLRHIPTEIDIDLHLAELPMEKAIIEHAEFFEAGPMRVPIPLPEDLILLKLIAGRDRDLGDIHGIIDRIPDLDLERLSAEVERCAVVLGVRDLAANYEKLCKTV